MREMIEAKNIGPMLSSTMSWSSVTAVKGFENRGLENKLSRFAKLFL